MAISVRQLSITGIAVVGAVAIALTPVGEPLQALILRNETVPPLSSAQLPGWIAEGNADWTHKSGGALPGAGGDALPAADTAVPHTALDVAALAATIPPRHAATAVTDLIEDPGQISVILAGLSGALTTSVTAAFTAVTATLTDAVAIALDNVVKAVGAVITDRTPVIHALAALLAALVSPRPAASGPTAETSPIVPDRAAPSGVPDAPRRPPAAAKTGTAAATALPLMSGPAAQRLTASKEPHGVIDQSSRIAGDRPFRAAAKTARHNSVAGAPHRTGLGSVATD